MPVRNHSAIHCNEPAPIRQGRLLRFLAPVMVLCLLAFPGGSLSAHAGKVLNDALATRPFAHHVFQEVLTQHVNARGEVHLVKLRANPKRLNQYLDQLAAVSPESHPGYFLNRNEQLAYWINAHNAIALRQVLDIYPVDSLERAPGLDAMARYRLGGKPYSLAMLRQKIAADFDSQPQALFALSDLSMNAPPLSPQAFSGESLARQLMRQRKLAVASGNLWRFTPGECVGLEISPYLKGFERALLQDEEGDNADAVLDQPLPPEHALGAARPAPTINWAAALRPYAPPAVYAELGRDCPHPVMFMPSDQRLRQVE